MKIHHVAIWTNRLEEMKSFYTTWFDASCNQKYTNPTTGFESYFLCFESGAKIELMQRADILPVDKTAEHIGIAHLAISVGSRKQVDKISYMLQNNGYKIVSPSRITGDGYYESMVLDPDNNRIEITE